MCVGPTFNSIAPIPYLQGRGYFWVGTSQPLQGENRAGVRGKCGIMSGQILQDLFGGFYKVTIPTMQDLSTEYMIGYHPELLRIFLD